MRSRQIKTINDLSRAERRALEGIDMMRGTNGVTMQTLRANGNRRDVVDRVCELGLAFAAGSYGDRELVRFALSESGRKLLADAEAPSYELLAQRYADLRAILVRLGPDWVEEIDRIEAADLRSTNDRPNAVVGATADGVVHAHAPGQVTCWISGCMGPPDDAGPASGSYPTSGVDRG